MLSLYYSPFPYLGSAYGVFIVLVLLCCASPLEIHLLVFLCNICPRQFLSSFFSLSDHFYLPHVFLGTSSSVVLSTRVNIPASISLGHCCIDANLHISRSISCHSCHSPDTRCGSVVVSLEKDNSLNHTCVSPSVGCLE